MFWVVSSGRSRQVVCVTVQLTPCEQKSLCQARVLSLCNPPAVQADLYKLPPLPASRGPRNIPTLLRKEIQVSGVSHGHVLLGPGRVS